MSDFTSKAKDAAGSVESAADRAGNTDSATAQKAGDAVQQSAAYRGFVTVGLIAYGFVHLVIAFIAAQIAWGGSAGEQEASSSGALQQISQQPFGVIILIVCAVGLAALVIWQLIEAAIGNQQFEGRKRLFKRLSSAGRGVVYGVLAFTAAQAAMGSSSGGEQKQESMISQILGMPGGVFIVAAVGIIITAVGISQIVSGARKSFDEDLDGAVAQWVMRLGQVGYATKGLSIALVGGLFSWSAVSHDPESAGGTNSALRTVVEQPFGPYLLSLVALGIVAFGFYCFVWAFNARHERPEGSGQRR